MDSLTLFDTLASAAHILASHAKWQPFRSSLTESSGGRARVVRRARARQVDADRES